MPKKPNAGKSFLPTEGGAAPAPVKPKRTTRGKATAAAAGATNGAAASFGNTEEEEIARLAYLLWQARGGQGGSAEDDWLRAEQEYRKKREASTR